MFGKKKAKKILSRVILTGLVCGSVLGYGGSAWAEVVNVDYQDGDSVIATESNAGNRIHFDGASNNTAVDFTYALSLTDAEKVINIGSGSGTLNIINKLFLNQDTTKENYGIYFGNGSVSEIKGNVSVDVQAGSAEYTTSTVRAVGIDGEGGQLTIVGNLDVKTYGISKSYDNANGILVENSGKLIVNGNTIVDSQHFYNGRSEKTDDVKPHRGNNRAGINSALMTRNYGELTLNGTSTNVKAGNFALPDSEGFIGYTVQAVRVYGGGTMNLNSTEETVIEASSDYAAYAVYVAGTLNATSKKLELNTVIPDGVTVTTLAGLGGMDSNAKINIADSVEHFNINVYGGSGLNSDAGTAGIFAQDILQENFNISAKELNINVIGGQDVVKDSKKIVEFKNPKTNKFKDYVDTFGLPKYGDIDRYCGATGIQGWEGGLTVSEDTETTIYVSDNYENNDGAVGILGFGSTFHLLGDVTVTALSKGENDTAVYVSSDEYGVWYSAEVVLGSEGKTVELNGSLYADNNGNDSNASTATIILQGSSNTVNGDVIAQDGGTITLKNTAIVGNVYEAKTESNPYGTVKFLGTNTVDGAVTLQGNKSITAAADSYSLTQVGTDATDIITINGNVSVSGAGSSIAIAGKAPTEEGGVKTYYANITGTATAGAGATLSLTNVKVDGTVTNNGTMNLNDVKVKSLNNDNGGKVTGTSITTTNGWTLAEGSVTVVDTLVNEHNVGETPFTCNVNGNIYAPSGTLDMRGVDLRLKGEPNVYGGTPENPTTLDTLKVTKVLFGDIYDGSNNLTIKNIVLENCTTEYRAALGVCYDSLTVDNISVDAPENWYWTQQYQNFNYQMYTGYGGTLTVNESLTTGEFMNASSSLGYTGILNLAEGAVLNCLDFQNTGNVTEETLAAGTVHVNGAGATLNAAALNNHAITTFGTVNLTGHPVLGIKGENVTNANYGTGAVLTIGTLNFNQVDTGAVKNYFRVGDNAVTTIGALTSSAVGADFYVTGTSDSTVNKDGGKAVQYIGDIVFVKYSDSDSVGTKFSLNLDSSDDYFTGSVRGTTSASARWGKWGWPINDDAVASTDNIKGMTLNLSNGATWTMTGDSVVNNLTMDKATIAKDTSVHTLTLQGGTSSVTDSTVDANVVVASDSTLNLNEAGAIIGTITNGGTLNLDGDLAKDIEGSGTTVLQADIVNVTESVSVAGTLDFGTGETKRVLNMQDEGKKTDTVLTIGKMKGNADLKFDVDLSDVASIGNDKLVINGVEGTPILNVTSVNVTKDVPLDKIGESHEVTYVSGDGAVSVEHTVGGSAGGSITVTNSFAYTFAEGTTKGTLAYTVAMAEVTFKKFIEGELMGNPAVLSLTGDMKDGVDGGLADVGRTAQANGTLTINLNSHSLGISGNTFTVTNIGTGVAKTICLDGGTTNGIVHTGWNVAAGGTLAVSGNIEINGSITNAGAVTFAGTTTVAGNLDGAGSYTNSGNLSVVDASKLQMSNGLDNSGILNLGSGTLGSKVTGVGTLNINGDVTTVAGNIATTGTNTVNSGKTLTLTSDGTGDDTLTVAIGGDGNLTINGDVSADADNIKTTGTNTVNSGKTLTITGGALTQAIGGAGSIAFDADMSVSAAKLTNTGTNTVNVGKTLTITDGSLAQTIGGAGNLTINGDVSADADNIKTTGTNMVNSGKTLTITDGSLAQTIGGAGNLTINGDVSADADSIKTTGTNTVNTGKTLTFTGGALTQAIGGAGSIAFDADMSVSAAKLTNTGTNTVNVGKTLTITDGSLAQTIGGAGNLTINGDVSADADNIKTTGTNMVNSGKTLTLTGDGTGDDTLTVAVGGAGNLTINGDVSADADNIKTTGTNTVNSGKTLTLTGDGTGDDTLTVAVGGAGNLTINGDVSADADNIKTTGTNTVNSGKTLTITDGSLTSNITNNGTVSMATGSSFGTGGKITGGNASLGNGVNFTKDNLENVSLSLDNAVYSIAGALSDNDGITLEKLNVAGASGTIVLGDIVLTGENLDSWADGEYKQIQFVTATGSNTLGVTNSKIVTIGDSTYTFGQAYLTAGDSASGLKFGFLEILKEIEGGGNTRTLQEMLDQETGDVKYVLKADEVITGTLQLRDIAGSVPRTLTLKGKGNSIIAGNDSSVLKNNNADTLSLENIGVKNFDTAVENKTEKGTVDLKSVTFTGTKTMDVVNDGTLNILDDKVNFAKGVSGTGTMNVKDNLTLNAGAGIEQNTINVDAGKILTNKGTITINNGSLNGDGTTALTNAGVVVINNGNLNTIVAGGVLEFDGESTAEKAEYIAGETNRIRSQAKLKLADEIEGELKAILEGDGEVIIDSAIDATGATEGGIKTRVTVNKDKSLTIYADKLGNVAANNGILNLKGGADGDGRILGYAVGGTGKTVITGGNSGAELTVTANAPITSGGGIVIDQYNVLKTDVGNLGADVTNKGTIKLFGGTQDNHALVGRKITGGIADIVGGYFDLQDAANIEDVETLRITDGSVYMDAEQLLDGTTKQKTAFGQKFEGVGGVLNLNNFGGKETYTSKDYGDISGALGLDGGRTTLMLSGTLQKAQNEVIVVQGNVEGTTGDVKLSDVRPKIVTDVSPSAGTEIASVPAEYVEVTKADSTELLATDKIIVEGGSNFRVKGFQIEELKDRAKGSLDLVVTGGGTNLTLMGGNNETGVVKRNTEEKVPVKLTVSDGAVFNAGVATTDSTTKNKELEFAEIVIDGAKMNVIGTNVYTPTLAVGNGGWLVVDPAYVKTDEVDIRGGTIQVVADGTVFNQGYDTATLRNYVERAGVATMTNGDGFVVNDGLGVMALKNSSGSTNVTISKTNGDHLVITADPSYNPATAPMLRMDEGALLILEGSQAQDSSIPAIIDLQNSTGPEDISVSNSAKVFVAGANAQGVGIYKLLHGNGVDSAGNYFGGNIYTDNTLYKIALLLPEEQIDNTFGFKLTWNEANTVFSAENLGVTRGAHDVANMVTDAVVTHFGNKEEGEKLWATFIHNKDKVDGLDMGSTTSQYDAQFNGTVIGYDLVDDQDITLGLALGYVNGNTANGTGHNDSRYNSFEVYGRKKVGAVQLHGDITYLHGKNETEMTVDGTSIKADAKTNTYSVGVRAEMPYKVGKGTLTPFAGLRYIRINGKDYSNNLGMEFSTNNLSSVVLPFGVSYKTAVNNFYGWKVKPEVAVGYAFNLGNRDSRTNVTHERVGNSYEFDVLDKGAFFAKAGISVSRKNFTMGVGYDYMKSKNSRNNRWNVNLSFSF